MEKAILKTLVYYDIFNFPLKAWEIHKWLIGKSSTLKQTEKAIHILVKKQKIKTQKGYYFLSGRNGIVGKRLGREQVSKSHIQIAKLISRIFKLIPWIKLVGISGSLSMMGSTKTDDIDLFIITSKNRIWVSRLLLIFLTSLTGLRRTRREKILTAHGKICINLILEESNLEQNKKNIYLAHEVLQMRPLWQKESIYSNFLHTNSWAFKYLPNWRSSIIESQESSASRRIRNQKNNSKSKSSKLINILEDLSKKLQLKIMGTPDNSERIETGALYFHPEDKGVKILRAYNRRKVNRF